MGGLEFDPRAIEIGHSVPTAGHLCNVSPPWFEAVLARPLAVEMSLATRLHTGT